MSMLNQEIVTIAITDTSGTSKTIVKGYLLDTDTKHLAEGVPNEFTVKIRPFSISREQT